MSFLLCAALAFVLLLGSAPLAGRETEIPSVFIHVEGAPHAVQMAPADVDAFQRRLNMPPVLFQRPLVGGVPVRIDTPYWDAGLRVSPDDPTIAETAFYYGTGGYVRLDRGGSEMWVVLELRQRAILDRYIRLARQGSLGPRPTALEVLAAASETEAIGVEVGGAPFEAGGPRGLWAAVRGGTVEHSFVEPPRPPPASNGYWLVITPKEGRSLPYFYNASDGTLTDALGTERHDARSLAATGALPQIPPPPLQIEHEGPPGSLLWWPLMVGGAVVLLALAVWLRRHAYGFVSGTHPTGAGDE